MHQWGDVVVALGIGIRAGVEQLAHHRHMAAFGGQHQRGDVLFAMGIDIGAVFQRRCQRNDIAGHHGGEQVFIGIGMARRRHAAQQHCCEQGSEHASSSRAPAGAGIRTLSPRLTPMDG